MHYLDEESLLCSKDGVSSVSVSNPSVMSVSICWTSRQANCLTLLPAVNVNTWTIVYCYASLINVPLTVFVFQLIGESFISWWVAWYEMLSRQPLGASLLLGLCSCWLRNVSLRSSVLTWNDAGINSLPNTKHFRWNMFLASADAFTALFRLWMATTAHSENIFYLLVIVW